MRLTRKAQIGAVIIGIGLLVPIVDFVWLSTIRTTLVNFPVPMHRGSIKQDFVVDYDADYIMGIDVDRKIPRTTVLCLLGANSTGPDGTSDCKNTPPVLSFSWKLLRDGQTVWNGTSSRIGSGPQSGQTTIFPFGIFPARRHHQYTVTMDFSNDGSGLSMAQPRLRVILGLGHYEDFIAQEIMSAVFAAVCCVVGGILFLIPIRQQRRRKRTILDSPSI
jgi:hypothetical protein